MAEALCGVCETEPKKYKCPTCALPYCSLSCFKLHKPSHTIADTPPIGPSEPLLPQPPLPAPAPAPRYLKKKTDFSVLATNPKFQELLKRQPALFTALQRTYAKTIEPDPEGEAQRHRVQRQAFRGRGSRGRGRGRFQGRFDERPPKWTPKRGDADAMGLLKGIREDKGLPKEKEAMAEFVQLVEEMIEAGEKKEGEGD